MSTPPRLRWGMEGFRPGSPYHGQRDPELTPVLVQALMQERSRSTELGLKLAEAGSQLKSDYQAMQDTLLQHHSRVLRVVLGGLITRGLHQCIMLGINRWNRRKVPTCSR